MSQNWLYTIKYIEWMTWVLFTAILIALYYHSMIIKKINTQIVESILVISFFISMDFIRKLKYKVQIELGLLKVYGKRNGYNSIMLLNIGVGVLWLILAFLSLSDINEFVFKLALGICFITGGLLNRKGYYIKITDKKISKLDIDFIKIKSIELITFSSDKIILKTAKRTMEIFYADLNNEEKQLIINDFEEIRLINNFAL